MMLRVGTAFSRHSFAAAAQQQQQLVRCGAVLQFHQPPPLPLSDVMVVTASHAVVHLGTMWFPAAGKTRSSATAKSTARPSCLVGILYIIYRETNNRSTTCTKLAMKPTEFREITQNNGHYNVQGRSRSSILIPIESPYTISY